MVMFSTIPKRSLAEEVMIWLELDGPSTARRLFAHMTLMDIDIPQWLRDLPGMDQLDEVPPLSTRVTIVVKAEELAL